MGTKQLVKIGQKRRLSVLLELDLAFEQMIKYYTLFNFAILKF